MDIQKRLMGPCAIFAPSTEEVKIDMDSFIWRLILFETYILVSVRLKEIPYLA